MFSRFPKVTVPASPRAMGDEKRDLYVSITEKGTVPPQSNVSRFTEEETMWMHAKLYDGRMVEVNVSRREFDGLKRMVDRGSVAAFVKTVDGKYVKIADLTPIDDYLDLPSTEEQIEEALKRR
jgi:hypothetical protein